jgi:hypothetical protein
MAKVDEHMKMSKRRWIGAALVGLALLTSWLLLSFDILPKTKVSSQYISPADGNVYSASGYEVHLPLWLGAILLATIVAGLWLLIWPRHQKTNS